MCLVLDWNQTLEISAVDNLLDKIVNGLPEPHFHVLSEEKVTASEPRSL